MWTDFLVLMDVVRVFLLAVKSTVCFMCLGNEGAPLAVRIYSFSSPGDLTKHFKKKHLKKVEEGGAPECKICSIPLDHKMHLQNHALRIHGTIS